MKIAFTSIVNVLYTLVQINCIYNRFKYNVLWWVGPACIIYLEFFPHPFDSLVKY